MSDKGQKKSFSPWRRWGLNLDLILRTVLVLAVVVMLNYLGARWHERFYLSPNTRQQLSPQTLGLLKSITNHIKITLFYDKDEPLFSTVSALLDQYRDANPRLHVVAVDYLRDAGAAEKIKAEYKNHLLGVTNKNLIIFDGGENRVLAINGRALTQYVIEVPDPEKLQYTKRTMFHGERLFNGALLAVTNPKPLRAYYLTGHDEHRLDGTDEGGYQTFASVLAQNYIRLTTLSLLGTNTVPPDCNLLIVGGPRKLLQETERDKIDEYLHQGGRLFALLNPAAIAHPTGLEKVLNGWGVEVLNQTVKDPQNTTKGLDVVAVDFSTHPVVNPLIGSQLQLWEPLVVRELAVDNPPADAPRVTRLAASSEFAMAGKVGPKRFPLAVAVEKGNVKGVITERNATRIVVVGDSRFLGNAFIDTAANRDFLGYAVNWLLERTQLMQGLGPRPVTEFRLTMTAGQLQRVQWLLLAALPGAVLALGALVWLRRRR
jgi:ABC-type uncharacterized transport system involved in gliding motility auxiliary subunit